MFLLAEIPHHFFTGCSLRFLERYDSNEKKAFGASFTQYLFGEEQEDALEELVAVERRDS